MAVMLFCLQDRHIIKERGRRIILIRWFLDVCLLEMAAEQHNEVKTQQMEENKENSIDESLGLESILTVKSLVIS